METIRFGTPSQKPPLLFIHGSYCGAWIWEKNFLPAFEKAGWSGAAISLRGHGRNNDVDHLDQFGVDDFLADIAQGCALFDKPPVLIGHSLGGYLVQRYAVHNPVAGIVLLSSPSLSGLGGSTQHILMQNPTLAWQLGLLMAFGPAFADQEVIGNALFLNGMPEGEKEHMLPLLQRESKRIAMEACWPQTDKPKEKVPTFVLGGANDAFVPESDFREEAAFWQGDLTILPETPHGLMLDACWPRAVDAIKGWLDKTYPG